MSDSSGTHPVYIGRELKKNVKLQATEEELTMRDVTERLIRRGMDQEYHKTPLPSEFMEILDDMIVELEESRTENEVDDILSELETVETDIQETQFPVNDATDELLIRVQSVRDKAKNRRPQVA